MKLIPKITNSSTFQVLVEVGLIGNMIFALFERNIFAALGWLAALGFFLTTFLKGR